MSKHNGADSAFGVAAGSALPPHDLPRRVVCAAILMDDGLIVTGVRHYSPDMRATLARIYGKGLRAFGKWWRKPYYFHEAEQGFIDQFGKFLTREEAFVLARQNGQCPHLPTTGTACLFSEDLY